MRKVLGATEWYCGNVKDLLTPVVVSFLIAIPTAWYIMNSWLQDFAYGTDIWWWMFAVSGLIVISIAFVTVSFQAISAAMANTIKNLRTE